MGVRSENNASMGRVPFDILAGTPDQETPSPIAEGRLQQRDVSPDILLLHVDAGAFDIGRHGDTDWLN